MEFVRADHLVVPEQACGRRTRRSRRATKATASTATTQRTSAQQPAVPLDVAQQRVDERERDEEEADVLEPFREVRRVERLQGVEDDDRGEDSAAASEAARPAGLGRRAAPRPEIAASSGGEDPAGDHQVERDQEVRGVAAGVERDAERERGDDRQRQQDGQRRKAAARTPQAASAGERRARRAAPGRRAGRTICGECHWSPRIRTGKRTSASSIAAERGRPGRQQDRGGRGGGGDQDAGAGEDVAQAPAPGPAAAGSPCSGPARRAVQAHHPGRDQGPVLAEQLDPQLVAAGRGDPAAAAAAVPVVGEEVVALEEARRGRG